MAGTAKKTDLGLLEEDDEFEEFPAEEWTAVDEDQADMHVWEDNWDDDTVEDDFSNQLRAELEKHQAADQGYGLLEVGCQKSCELFGTPHSRGGGECT